MEKKLLFYGTPLSRSLNNDQQNDEGPIGSRKARLNEQQTVRDSHGRQRFHGAFTGGYSAGYFNTVDSTAGFQPRQFVSRREDKRRDGGGTSFSHKPEDYMDEEDLGEFGIAPKKVRVLSQYSSDKDSPAENVCDDFVLRGLLKPATLSIGELILKRMSTNCTAPYQSYLKSSVASVKCQNFVTKDNFHGLGYKPLEVASRKANSSNPLTAILGSGKRLKISGEAFGTGVLDDDEDYLATNDAYGYDDIGNYEFDRKSKNPSSKVSSNLLNDDRVTRDHCHISGFILAKKVDAMHICDTIKTNYSMPSIPNDWKMPIRAEPYIPPLDSFTITQQLNLKSHPSSSSFNKKFTCASQSTGSDSIETKAGLVLYSDLKADESKTISSTNLVASDESQNTKATLVRKELEWRPCSLLCKHFNVPNPFPDNLFAGVKPSNLVVEQDFAPLLSSAIEEQQSKEIYQEPASLGLKRMIFDVIFTNHYGTNNEEVQLVEDRDDSEDEPQVVEIDDTMACDKEDQQAKYCYDDDDDPDVLIVTASKQEPEVIVLSSSSSQSSPSPQQPLQQPSRSSSPTHLLHGNDECHMLDEPPVDTAADTYGPPLPPTLRTLIDLDRRHDQRHHSRSRQKKKKKHKKSKRNS